MSRIRRQFVQFGKPALAVLLEGVVLLLDAMDADKAGHHCAVTMFAHGKVESASCEVVIPPPTIIVETVRYFTFSIFSPAVENLPHGRAPPALSAVS
jgi:hypothetical protein